MNEIAMERYAWLTSMVGVFRAMPTEERKELLRWEKDNVDGHSVRTLDWPGWEKYIGKMPQTDQKVKEQQKAGFVYLLSSEVGFYKIGQSKNVAERVRSIATLSPVHLMLSHTIHCDDRFMAERILHERFARYRERGEWFQLPKAQMEEIRHLARFECGQFHQS